MTQQRNRSNVFGEEADQYEAARPGYPGELVTDVLADAGPGPALEVGAGTGKATVAFAAHDVELTCLEPDARMAGVLSRRVADFPQVSVVGDRFETWPPDRGYGLLYSARTAALTAVSGAIDTGGGEIEITVDTSMATARRS